jgi:hypothetical protein
VILVISMHDAGGWPVQQREISGWNAVADEHGFIGRLRMRGASPGSATSRFPTTSGASGTESR